MKSAPNWARGPPSFEAEGKQLEAHRLRQRTAYDIEMLKEIGFTSGIENYKSILDGRPQGSPPHTLIDYFPDDFVVFVDEIHQTIPQIGGMFEGDRSRKQTLIGTTASGCLRRSTTGHSSSTSSSKRVPQLVMVSATPGPFERAESTRVVEQIVRPTGIVCHRDRGARHEEPDRRPDERDQGAGRGGRPRPGPRR